MLLKNFRFNNSGAFSNSYEAVCRHVRNSFAAAVRPANIQIHFLGSAEPEVKPQIVGRVKTGLAQDLLRLRFAAIMCRYTSPDCAAVRFRPNQLDLQPVG